MLIGEYGLKNDSRQVCASNDWGDNWKVIYSTPERKGVHIHRVAIDNYTNDWWITVGDTPDAGRVLYSSDKGQHWNEVACPKTGNQWQPYQPCNILYFEEFILIVNEPSPQVFKVDRKTIKAEYISNIVNYPHAPPYSVIKGNYGIYASLVHYPEDNHDAGIIVSYDKGYTWHRLINFTAWAKQEYQSIIPLNVFGANHIIYENGFIYANWIYWPWVETKGEVNEGELDGGLAFKFKDMYYIPLIQSFEVDLEGEGIINPIFIHSNSLVTQFNFNQALCQINFNVFGDSNALGYCNITILKAYLKYSKLTITIDDVPITDFIQNGNATHSFLYFTYPQKKKHHIVIQGIWVTSEVPIAPILLLHVVLLVITFILTKQRLSRNLKT